MTCEGAGVQLGAVVGMCATLRGRRATLRGCGVWKIPPTGVGQGGRQARRVGAFLTAVATAAGYDVRRRQGGRAQLAAVTGLSLTTISRTLDGKTLPLPSQLTTWATVLNLDHRRMLVESGLIPEQRGPQSVEKDVVVASVLSAQEAMVRGGSPIPSSARRSAGASPRRSSCRRSWTRQGLGSGRPGVTRTRRRNEPFLDRQDATSAPVTADDFAEPSGAACPPAAPSVPLNAM